MDMDHLSQITSNAFSTRSDTDQDGISLALYLTEKLIGQMDVDDDDEVGYITNILHNALISDKKFRVLDTCQKAGLDFTMPIHFQGSLICLRDKCLVSGYGAAVIQKMADMGVDMDTGVINGRTPANIIASQRGNSLTSGKKNDFLSQSANFFSQRGLAHTRYILEQHMPARKDRGKRLTDHPVLALHYLIHFGDDLFQLLVHVYSPFAKRKL